MIDREGGSFPVDPPPELARERPACHGPAAHRRSASSRAADKDELRRSYQADLVDMETSAVAAFCGEKLVRFLSIRVISDDAHADLPHEVAAIMNPLGGLSRRSGHARVLAATFEPQGFLDALRALRSRPPTGSRNSSRVASTSCRPEKGDKSHFAAEKGTSPIIIGLIPFFGRSVAIFPVKPLAFVLGGLLGHFASGILGPPADHKRLGVRRVRCFGRGRRFGVDVLLSAPRPTRWGYHPGPMTRLHR